MAMPLEVRGSRKQVLSPSTPLLFSPCLLRVDPERGSHPVETPRLRGNLL